jgi:DNA-directed RNA polymerase subunit K/omega
MVDDDVTTTTTNNNNNQQNVLTRHRIMSRYERATVIGERMEQLRRGAMPLVLIPEGVITTVRKIALQELEERKLPFSIVRTRPDGSKAPPIPISELLL